MFSITVRWPNRLKLWNTMPIFLRTLLISHFGSVISTPSTHTWPEVGFSIWLMQRSKVLLPVPDGPMTEITSPSLISTLTSSRGTVLGYSFLRCSILIMKVHPFNILPFLCSRGRRCPSDSVSASGDYRDFSVKCFHDRRPFLLFPASGRIAQQHGGSPGFGQEFSAAAPALRYRFPRAEKTSCISACLFLSAHGGTFKLFQLYPAPRDYSTGKEIN